ncbi:MAG: hypothetical protein QF570_19725 [Myxococcota bacterium]|jgi:hypothetical protein|nr:hypothetical protein [Myxococcota bacterium]
MSRRDRLIQEHRHDPYQARAKLKEPSVCSGCQAAFHNGRWQSLSIEDDRYPSGGGLLRVHWTR